MQRQACKVIGSTLTHSNAAIGVTIILQDFFRSVQNNTRTKSELNMGNFISLTQTVK